MIKPISFKIIPISFSYFKNVFKMENDYIYT